MKKFLLATAFVAFAGCLQTSILAQSANVGAAAPLVAPTLPNGGASVLRVMGALALVIGIFLGGVWLFRNWQRLVRQHGQPPKLNIIEIRPLGGRQALYVVGYEEARFLLASSPSGVSLLTHLPDAVETPLMEKSEEKSSAPFPLLLAQLLKGK
jgi:flagellar biogenesis protein FliO